MGTKYETQKPLESFHTRPVTQTKRKKSHRGSLKNWVFEKLNKTNSLLGRLTKEEKRKDANKLELSLTYKAPGLHRETLSFQK